MSSTFIRSSTSLLKELTVSHDIEPGTSLVERMRRLVSLAGENQGRDQHSLDDTLANVSTQLTTLCASVAEQGKDVVALRSSIFALGERMTALEQRMRVLQTDVAALGAGAAADEDDDGDDDDARIRDIIAVAQEGTEQRLAAHVDEVLFALAEALVRSRNTAPGSVPDRQIDLNGVENPAVHH